MKNSVRGEYVYLTHEALGVCRHIYVCDIVL